MLTVMRGTSGRPSTNRAGTCTGEVWRDPVRDTDRWPSIGNLFLAPSARTYWHVHLQGQLVIAVAGAGGVADDDGAVRLAAGDMVWTPNSSFATGMEPRPISI